MDEQSEKILSLQAEVRILRAALKPFAQAQSQSDLLPEDYELAEQIYQSSEADRFQTDMLRERLFDAVKARYQLEFATWLAYSTQGGTLTFEAYWSGRDRDLFIAYRNYRYT